MTGLEWLSTLHTKQLMNLRKEYKRFLFRSGWGNVTFDIPDGSTVTVNISEINEVLGDRPHIPRCSDTKRIRQIADQEFAPIIPTRQISAPPAFYTISS